jgi:uncharacterized protein YbaR (Trm112 family)
MDHTLGKILVCPLTREPVLSPCYLALRKEKVWGRFAHGENS